MAAFLWAIALSLPGAADGWPQAGQEADPLSRPTITLNRLNPLSAPNQPSVAPTDNPQMTVISPTEFTAAADAVLAMDLARRVQLADEIHAHQPQLLASVLVLPRYGVTLVQLDGLINILLTLYQVMKASTLHWPVVSEDVQERGLQRVVRRVRFIEGLTPPLQTQAVHDALAAHPQQPMLAWVFGEMKDVLGVETEAQKMMMFAALNLVECIAESAQTRA